MLREFNLTQIGDYEFNKRNYKNAIMQYSKLVESKKCLSELSLRMLKIYKQSDASNWWN